jgi:hypothetical protein
MKIRRMMVVGLVALAAQAVVLAGCEEDLTPQKTAWASTVTAHTNDIEGFKTKNKDLIAKLDKLAPKADGSGAAAKMKLMELAKAQGADITALEAAFTSSKDAITKAQAGGKVADMTTAIEGADKSWKAAYDKVSAGMTISTKEIAALEALIAEEAKAPAAATGVDTGKVSHMNGKVDFSDIDHQAIQQRFARDAGHAGQSLPRVKTGADWPHRQNRRRKEEREAQRRARNCHQKVLA